MPSISILKSNGFILSILILQIIVYFVIYADILFARMVICFLYLLFAPGIVILKFLALKTLDISDRILFSVGLSIAFLMFIGVAINELGKLVFANPLSLNLLIVSINTILLLFAFISNRYLDSSLTDTVQSKLLRYLFPILLSISLLLLGSYGIFIVNYFGNNLFILLLIIMISVIVPIVFLKDKAIPSNFYPSLLLIIFICTLLFVSTSYSLITPYITGQGDQWNEYYTFKLTGHFWDSAFYVSSVAVTSTYSMISVTILPVIFSTITEINSSLLFKLLYPLLVSFTAIGAYKLYQTQTDNKTAFLATFFLITISVGKGLGPSKQEIAQLFYVLLFLLFLKKDISSSKRSILLVIFGAALVISHYGLSYIFLLTMVASVLILALLNYQKTGRIPTFQAKIPPTFILIFSTFVFSWYIFANGSTIFTLLGQTVDTVTSNLNQFFDPASRGTALQGLGLVQTPTIYNLISSALFILTEFFVLLGFIKLLTSRNKTSKFSIEYKVFATLNMAVIAINILLPRIADTFLMARFYQTTLIMLAPLAIIGGKAMFEFVLKHRFQKFYVIALAFVVFIPLFLFQTGFVYEVARVESYSLPLSLNRWDPGQLYDYIVNTQEVVSAQWIPQHVNLSNILVYSDRTSISNVLRSYGLISSIQTYTLANTTRPTSNTLIYLADTNLIRQGYIFNASVISPILENQNKIYSNGECEIYEGTP